MNHLFGCGFHLFRVKLVAKNCYVASDKDVDRAARLQAGHT